MSTERVTAEVAHGAPTPSTVLAPASMSTKDPVALERAANGDSEAQIDERDVRALQQYLTVLDDVGRARGADDLYLVTSESGSEYLVDAREQTCECPDHEYRNVRCKHIRRVAFATGAEPIPTSVDDVDPQLGMHVEAAPATDGGMIVAEDDAEILEDADAVDQVVDEGEEWSLHVRDGDIFAVKQIPFDGQRYISTEDIENRPGKNSEYQLDAETVIRRYAEISTTDRSVEALAHAVAAALDGGA